MKTPKIITLALSLLGASLAPALAAPVSYLLDVPLYSDGLAIGSLKGTLSPNEDVVNDFVDAKGTFTLVDTSAGLSDMQDWTGSTFIMPSDGQTGVLFNSDASSAGSLYFSLSTTISGDPSSTGQVSFCGISGSCTLYDAIGASMIQAVVPPVSLPGKGGTIGFSPVPLPPAMWMFGGALLVLAGMGAMNRRAPATKA